MIHTLYYPSIEFHSQRWLKFALLYLDDVGLIAPPNSRRFRSEDARLVINETDLFTEITPTALEIANASADALGRIDEILKHPERYRHIYGGAFVGFWKNPDEQRSVLFRGKYDSTWSNALQDEKLARRTRQGLMVKSEVARLYMSFLTKHVAEERERSPFTDIEKTHEAVNVSMRVGNTPAAILVAQSPIAFALPNTIDDISISDLIEHRQKDTTSKRRRAFQREFLSYLESAESNNRTPNDFKDSLGAAWKDFSSDIVALGSRAAAFCIVIQHASGGNINGWMDMLRHIFAGTYIGSDTVRKFTSIWRESKDKRLCRRYLSDLENIRNN